MSSIPALDRGGAGRGGPMDALDLLEQQHRDVRERLERLALEASGSCTKETIDAVVRVVEAHVRIEEAYVYVACASKLRSEPRAMIAADERASTLATLRLLRVTAPSDPNFASHVTTLVNAFVRHVELEEDVVFPKLKRTLTDEALDVLGEALSRAHERFLVEDKPWLENEPERVSRRAVRSVRDAVTLRTTIVRSGVRQKIRPTTCG